MSIINTNYGFVFVHIPKCAGTTVTHTLSKLTTMFDLEIGGTEYGEAFQKLFVTRFNIYKHSMAWEIRNALGREKWARYFTFTFVRNPYARAWSTYKYILQHNDELQVIQPGQSFSDFVASPAWDRPGPFQMLRPQSAWLVGAQNKEETILDYVARVEDFDTEIRTILDLIGVHPAKLGQLAFDARNVSSEPPQPPVIGKAALGKIRRRYERDFSRLGYDVDDVPFTVE